MMVNATKLKEIQLPDGRTMYKGRLKTGTKFIFDYHPDGTAFAIGAGIPYGAAYDSPFPTGTSHFVEHMIFRCPDGSRRRENLKALENAGGMINSFTLYNMIGSTNKAPSNRWQIGVNSITQLLSRDIAFTEDDLNIERGTIYHEIVGCEDSPDQRAYDLLQEALFHFPYGRPITGTAKDLKKITLADIYNSWNRMRDSSQMTFVCAGNAPLVDLVEYLEQNIRERMLVGNNTERIAIEAMPRYMHAKETRRGIEQAKAGVAFHIRPFGRAHPVGLKLINHRLVEGIYTSTLYSKLVESKGDAYGATPDLSIEEGYGAYMLVTGTSPKMAKKAGEIMVEEFRTSWRMSHAEFSKLKESYIGKIQTKRPEWDDLVAEILCLEMAGRNGESYYKEENLVKGLSLDDLKELTAHRKCSSVLILPGKKFKTKFRSKKLF